jgi:hypothetical protein
MNYQVIAEGEDLNALELCESMFVEGDHGEVRAFVTAVPPIATLQGIEQQIRATGVALTAPVRYDADSGAVLVRFQKFMPVLQVISQSLAALLVIGASVFAWQVAQAVGGGSAAGIWIVLGVLGFVLFVKSAEGKAFFREAAGAARHVGRVYTARRMFIDKPTQHEISEEVRRTIQEEAQRAARTGGAPYYTGGAPRAGGTGFAGEVTTAESDIDEEG